eukprot:SAG11_NODE_1439_length_4907_cov_2.082571_5_plen_80_part_00
MGMGESSRLRILCGCDSASLHSYLFAEAYSGSTIFSEENLVMLEGAVRTRLSLNASAPSASASQEWWWGADAGLSQIGW